MTNKEIEIDGFHLLEEREVLLHLLIGGPRRPGPVLGLCFFVSVKEIR